MALYSQKPLSPWAEVIKDVKELFLTGGDAQLDAWLCSKGNKITSSLCDPCAAAVSSTGGTTVLAEVFWKDRTVPEFLQPPGVPKAPGSWCKVEGVWSQIWSSFGCSSEPLEHGECSNTAERPWGG